MKIQIQNLILLFGLFTSQVLFADKTITVGSGTTFSPVTETITLGEKITFSFAGGFHNAVSTSVPSGASSFVSDVASSNVRTVDFTPTVVGVYNFNCQIHGNSMTFGLTVNAATVSPTIAISTPTNSSFCTSNVISFMHTITGTFAGGFFFNVQLSDNTGGFTNPTAVAPTISGVNVQFTLPTIASGTGYRIRLFSTSPVILSNNNGTDLSFNVLPNPSVSIQSNALGSICVNTPVTITANALNTSGTVNYAWEINNSVVGSNSNTLSTSTLANGDNIICTITAQPAGCGGVAQSVSSNTIITTVSSSIVPNISITGSRNYPNYCTESITTLTANILGGGSAPILAWKIMKSDGTTILGSGFLTTTLGQFAGTVQVNLTSSLSCASPNSVVSNVLVFDFQATTLQDDPLIISLIGSNSLTVTSRMGSYSSIPTIYNWYLNNAAFANTTTLYQTSVSGIYKINYLYFNGCLAISSDFNFQYNSTSIVPEKIETGKITIYPNPAKDRVLVASSGGIKKRDLKIQVYDQSQKLVLKSTFYEGVCEGGKGKDCLCPGTSEIDVSSLEKGMHFVLIFEGKKTIFNGKLLKE